MRTRNKNFAEFFAGVGLVREGLRRHEWNCVWANDISEHKRETYIKNYSSDHFYLDDIWDITKKPVIIPNDIFLYTASFPCTDLSVAGNRKGLAGAESGTLNAFLQIVNEKKKINSQPKVILLENVKGFLTSKKGKDVAYTVEALNKSGYIVDIVELDASSFTPQSRQRVFLIAVETSLAMSCMHIKNKDTMLDSWWSKYESTPKIRSSKLKKIIELNNHLDWGLLDIPQPKDIISHLNEIIEIDIPQKSQLWWNDLRKSHLFSQMSNAHKEILKLMIEKSKYSYGTVYRRMRKGKSMAELRTDGKAGCLRTPRGGSSKQILIRAGHGKWDVRLLTPREYARLQGVRDDFTLPDNANKGYFAMGDAVCVPVIEFISKYILIPLHEKSYEQNSLLH
ncbi:DNA (cytosine-5)-methyltransferase 1 [Candidatus Electrothrix aarhusensis]|uniref:DNA (cytosine-5-)-methyltransferase n=1 Tax=Candidatus Electrothrix aarhusensis TaxID=1859131 RepID=A0A3S3QTA1_9BACT|nr:DNA (cytosine-5)-methyltransferase 1 [Candidatus Electrothrix aarhusensis]